MKKLILIPLLFASMLAMAEMSKDDCLAYGFEAADYFIDFMGTSEKSYTISGFDDLVNRGFLNKSGERVYPSDDLVELRHEYNGMSERDKQYCDAYYNKGLEHRYANGKMYRVFGKVMLK
ncbi:hypothetical protein ABXV23_25770 [Vibrio owensii]|uniref:hypothetical protein n=1 Tax=Vibrio owensii TaxID=696485 RepID=UPI003391A72D